MNRLPSLIIITLNSLHDFSTFIGVYNTQSNQDFADLCAIFIQRQPNSSRDGKLSYQVSVVTSRLYQEVEH